MTVKSPYHAQVCGGSKDEAGCRAAEKRRGKNREKGEEIIMKKSSFVAMILGTVGGILFALGMCMALIPEWNAFNQGIIMGVIGEGVKFSVSMGKNLL